MEKKQLIFIHGAQSFSDYEAFLEHLRTCELWNVLEEKPRRWRETLRAALGPEYEVYLPSMPNGENAKYDEWKIWFERYLALVRNEVVLIGHSQGGYFLAKYLIENEPRVVIRALFLVAAPIGPDDFGGEDGGDFSFDRSRLPSLAERAHDVFVVHSTDDPVVPMKHAEAYAAALPGAHTIYFTDRGHFLQESFPEIIKLIQDLS